MNKKICKMMKKRGDWERKLCYLCTYSTKCIDFNEHRFGHDDINRELSQTKEE